MRRLIVCFLITIFGEIKVSPQQVYDYEASSDDGIAVDPLRVVPGKSKAVPGITTTYAPFVFTERIQPPLPEGPFFEFMVDICYALISPKYAKVKVGPYFRILRKCLKGLGTDILQKLWIRRLCRRLLKYSAYNKKRIKLRVFYFLKYIADGKPKKNKYINSMNAIFTMKQIIKLDDYVYELKRYGKNETEHIGQKTRDVLVNIVFGTFWKQSHEARLNIERCFKAAVVEHWEANLNLTAFNRTTRAP